ncbi:MAG: HAD family hydrolase [Candidatus Daviesbacteria bacterium]|nr:MAG: HAD family hydrolase [Candidatus Daviesbacteria bacterium]
MKVHFKTPQKTLVKAVFLDRDGTINNNQTGYTYKINDFVCLPGVIESLVKFSKTSYKIIILTNQSGIGRKYFSFSQFHKLNNWMLKEFKKNNVRIDKVFFCPHHPQNNCSCRKPKPGLIIQAVQTFGISLEESWLIGDDERDIILAKTVNLRSIKIGAKISRKLKLEPNYYVKNLPEALDIITNQDRLSLL